MTEAEVLGLNAALCESHSSLVDNGAHESSGRRVVHDEKMLVNSSPCADQADRKREYQVRFVGQRAHAPMCEVILVWQRVLKRFPSYRVPFPVGSCDNL